MFEWIYSPEAWIALATLSALEIVLGIDNIIFISILVAKLPVEKRDNARRIGLILAMVSRLVLLFSISWIMGLTKDIFEVFNYGISGRDIILVLGGLFLLAKSTHEIHNSLEDHHGDSGVKTNNSFSLVLIQIALLDVVFSFDSVITAVGLADHVSVMAIAIILSVGVMLLASKSISDFVDANPTIKILALSFLILVGVTLIAEGFDAHVPKGYIYFAMAFSVVVEMINIKMRKNQKNLKLQKVPKILDT
ncbi:MAG: Integral membrane protein TerC [uncultured Campylobacterales bacterium]|uniref:Integral membrane protein TerC n=1 Tax=uncultured Campylobacterales bacterium TaxID=352960 RepID=A0A6S6RV53_9BACT|nr:MAG: Integral membrane protein TerC [uncultured Campylobacterales bacterium]